MQNTAKPVVAPILPVAAGVGIADENGGDMPGVFEPSLASTRNRSGKPYSAANDLPAKSSVRRVFGCSAVAISSDPRTESRQARAEIGADMQQEAL